MQVIHSIQYGTGNTVILSLQDKPCRKWQKEDSIHQVTACSLFKPLGHMLLICSFLILYGSLNSGQIILSSVPMVKNRKYNSCYFVALQVSELQVSLQEVFTDLDALLNQPPLTILLNCNQHITLYQFKVYYKMIIYIVE